MALAPGKRLGSFEITALIGVGGMGEVYRARDTKLGREVAIKVLPPELASDPERLSRFEREARILASLDHPKIGALYDFEREHDGEPPYLVLQLVEGETLADRLARGPLSADEAIAIFSQIAEALEAAHEVGIVHRDLKPANVKLSADDQVKVLDFGIARASEGRTPGGGVPTPTGGHNRDATAPTLTLATPPSLTGEGAFVGTPDFMSPEQARGKKVDRRADIWAFGVCLYQALTSRLPFAGETWTDRLSAILRDEVDLGTLPPEVPPGLRKLLRRCLEKDVRWRLRDIGEAWVLLRGKFQEDETPRAEGAAEVVRFTVQLPPGHRVSTFSYPFAVSNDGRTIVVCSSKEEVRRLLVRRLDELDTRELQDTEHCYLPFYSPDGEWVGFFRRRQLRRVRVEGGPAQTLTNLGARALCGLFTPDNSIVWGELGSGLKRLPAAGGEVETLTEPDRDRGELWHAPLSLCQGSYEALCLVSIGRGSGDELPITHLEAVSLASGERRRLLQDVRAPGYLLADGTLVFARGDSVFALPVAGRRETTPGDPVRLLSGVDISLDEVLSYYALSPAGTLVYSRNQRREESSTVCWVSRQGDRRAIPLPTNVYLGPRVSPDGEQIAFVCRDAAGSMQVFVYDMHRRVLERITREGKLNIVPVWHPGGHGLAFSTVLPPPIMKLFSLEDGRVTVLAGSGDPEWPSSYSPDGKWLAITRMLAADHVVIEVRATESGEVETFVDSHALNFCPKFDPTGELIAYVSDELGRREVYLEPFHGRGRRLQVSIDGGADPVWSPRGEELFYRTGDTVMAVKVERGERLRVGKPEPVFDFPFRGPVSLFAPSFDVHPDGERFVVTDAVAEAQGATEIVVVVNWQEELRRLLRPDSI